MASQLPAVAKQNIKDMKLIIADEGVVSRMNNMLGKEASTFLASVLDLYTSDNSLTNCSPRDVMAQCMKAAALKLPVSKALGFCYIIAYKNVPTFVPGYKAYIQLAQRSGQYRYINAGEIYKGEVVVTDRITGQMSVSGEAKSDEVVGYFAYFQLLNGFEKCIYWTKDKVTAHAKRYSKSYANSGSAWQTNFDAMALKTVIKHLISKYGVMSVEFAKMVTDDRDDAIESEVEQYGNASPIVLPAEETEPQMLPAHEADDELQGTTDGYDPDPDF